MTKKTQASLKVTPRDVFGRAVKKLRKELIIPANIMGMGQKSEAVLLESKDFYHHLESEGESGLLYLQIDGSKKNIPVLIEDIQLAPVDGSVVHVVFRRVNLLEKVTAEVPVETTGEFEVKNANLVLVTDSLEVEALPADLPESFVIDLSLFTEVGQNITIKDLVYDREKITILMTEEESENPIAMAQEQREEEPEEAPAEEVGDASVESEEGDSTESEEDLKE